MIPKFTYVAPASIADVLDTMADLGPGARVLAGGTDIVPGLYQNSRRFEGIDVLVDINGVSELKEISLEGEELHIGAACSFSEISQHPLIQVHSPVLAKAVSLIGSLQIRNRATIGGNFVNNAPCADSVPPLLVHEARVCLIGPSGGREMPLEAFLIRPYNSQLKKGELVTKIVVPVLPQGFSGDFFKLGRRRGVAISRITLAVLIRVDGGIFSGLRVASGAVTPIGLRFHELESSALGEAAQPATFKYLAHQLGEDVLETTGLRWSSEYKLPVLQQLLFQILCNMAHAGRS